MTYRGKIKNGVVVLEGPESPPEGAEVTVNVVEPVVTVKDAARKGRLRDFVGVIKDTPPDLSKNHDHYLYGTPKEE